MQCLCLSDPCFVLHFHAIATLGAAWLFKATPLLCNSWAVIALPLLRPALRFSSALRHCPSMLVPARLSRRAAGLSISVPLLLSAVLSSPMQCRRYARRCLSLPLLCGAGQLLATQCRCYAVPIVSGLCCALATLIIAPPFLCYAVPCQAPRNHAFAVPLLSRLSHRFSMRLTAFRCEAIAWPFEAMPLRCFPLGAYPGHAIADQSLISSQVNRPLPLFCHWPMPRRMP